MRECPAVSKDQLLLVLEERVCHCRAFIWKAESLLLTESENTVLMRVSVCRFMQSKHEAWSIFQCLWSSELLLTCTDSSAAWNHDKRIDLQSQVGKTYHATSPPVAHCDSLALQLPVLPSRSCDPGHFVQTCSPSPSPSLLLGVKQLKVCVTPDIVLIPPREGSDSHLPSLSRNSMLCFSLCRKQIISPIKQKIITLPWNM